MQDRLYHEYFGFTDEEVRSLLSYYGYMDQYSAIKEWYDGYQFHSMNIYCPWDVINDCADLRSEFDAGCREAMQQIRNRRYQPRVCPLGMESLSAAKGWMPGKSHSLILSRQQVPEQGVNSNYVS